MADTGGEQAPPEVPATPAAAPEQQTDTIVPLEGTAAHGEVSSLTATASGGVGYDGRITNKVHDREEEYAFVTPNDLRDVAAFGLMEYVLSQTGGFFFAGALWETVSILAQQKQFEITPWLMACGLSMIFGLVLAVVGFIMFRMRQSKIKKYFPRASSK